MLSSPSFMDTQSFQIQNAACGSPSAAIHTHMHAEIQLQHLDATDLPRALGRRAT